MISFIILNYKSLNDTIECIESINKLNCNEKISIIVVDNNSMNLEQQKVILKYTKDLILLNENIGFAKGNNIGCEYAIKKYKPDFLCVINSDTIINQNNFIDLIYELYEQYSFDVLGPKILPEKTESCNPFKAYTTLDEVQKKIIYTQKLIKIYENKFLRLMLEFYLYIKSFFRKEKSITNGMNLQMNVALHGCALIFPKKYYEKFEHIFYPGTFLFHEEEFLYLRCKKNKLISLYSPDIEIIHKEGQSIAKKFNNKKYESLIFRNKEILKSLNLLKEEMKKDSKDVDI